MAEETMLFTVLFVAVIVAFVMLVMIAVADDLTMAFNHALETITTNTSAPGYTVEHTTISLVNTFFIVIFVVFIAVTAIVIMYRRRV